MESARHETIDYYRARARYERLATDEGWSPEVAEALASLARTDLGSSVLELAAGTGVLTNELAQRDVAVTAVDAAPEALDVNRRRLQDRAQRVELIVTDLFTWEPGRTWDSCVASFWLCKVPDALWASHLAWLARVVRPGGAVWFFDKLAAAEPVEELEVRAVDDGQRFRIVDHPRTRETLRASLLSAGFDVDVQPLGRRLCVIAGTRLQTSA